MSSYHAFFKYAGYTSLEHNLRIVAFEPDDGEMDAFLGMEAVFTESYHGTKRNVYGYKYNNVATIKITLVKQDYSDFTVQDNRTVLGWLTGNHKTSWLDFYDGFCSENIEKTTPVYRFLGNFVGASQYKKDARVIGIVMTFESVSPWAYSSEEEELRSFNNDNVGITYNEDGDAVLYLGDENNSQMDVIVKNNEYILVNNSVNENGSFNITNYNVIYLGGEALFEPIIRSDDLYTYIYPNVTYVNKDGSDTNNMLVINNHELHEETHITNIAKGETITISSGQFITSDIDGKIFGESFYGMRYNDTTKQMQEAYCVWPRLKAGYNKLVVHGSGSGTIKLSYIYPMKIGDCAMDINNILNNPACIEVGGMLNMKMRVNKESNQVEYTIDEITWHPVIPVSELASAIGTQVILDDTNTLTIGEQK